MFEARGCKSEGTIFFVEEDRVSTRLPRGFFQNHPHLCDRISDLAINHIAIDHLDLAGCHEADLKINSVEIRFIPLAVYLPLDVALNFLRCHNLLAERHE